MNKEPSESKWYAEIGALSLSNQTDPVAGANENMCLFDLGAPQDWHSILPLIMEAFRIKAKEASQRGIFYAWVDEMAGQLRCSFCRVASASELPFGCRTFQLEHIDQLAELASSTAGAIACSELEACEYSEPESDSGSTHVLRLYAELF